jgi:membrane protein DedA with SNARE-associated domain
MGTAWAIFGVVLSTLVVPLPEELALLGAGWMAHAGNVSLGGAYLACWAAIVLGDSTTYLVGRVFLPRLLRTRIGQKILTPPLRAWGEGLVQRHGFRAILLGRFLVGLRGPVYLAIGAARYPPARFTLINSAVGLLEVALMVGAGYLFGRSQRLASEMRWVEVAIALAVAVMLILPLVLKRQIERRHAAV